MSTLRNEARSIMEINKYQYSLAPNGRRHRTHARLISTPFHSIIPSSTSRFEWIRIGSVLESLEDFWFSRSDTYCTFITKKKKKKKENLHPSRSPKFQIISLCKSRAFPDLPVGSVKDPNLSACLIHRFPEGGKMASMNLEVVKL